MTSSRSTGGRQALVARLRRQAWEAQRRIEASPHGAAGINRLFAAIALDRAISGNLLACAVAFRLFIWILPMMLALVAALGFVEAYDDPESLGEGLAFEGEVLAAVVSSAQDAEKPRWILLAIAVFGLYTAGTAAARTVQAVHELAWGLERQQRSSGLRAALAFTGAAVLLLGVAVVTHYIRQGAPGAGLGAMVAIGLVYAVVSLALSTVLPHGAVPWTRLVPGAIVFGAGTQLLHVVTVVYLAGRLATASELYGGLGVAATLLLGLYFVARLLVVAAVFNASAWQSLGRGEALAGGRLDDDASA